jgi:hypothetical protein
LGLGDTETRGDEPGEMGDHLPIVALGAERSVLAIAASENGACALFATHEMKCWGENSHGELGLGDYNNRGDVPGEMDENLPVIDLGPGF